MNRVNRLKQRRKKRLMISLLFACIVLIGLIIWYYIKVQSPMWELRKESEQLLLAQSDLVQIEHVHQFVTDSVYTIATGFDEHEEPFYVALNEEGSLYTFQAENGVTQEEITQMHLDRHPDAKIVRIRPGIWRGYWVWEVYYRMEEASGIRPMYDYYHLANGELLETFKLRLKH